MKPTRTPLKAALALAALSATALLATPAHAGLIGNGSFETLAVAGSATPPADGSEVAVLQFKAAETAASAEASSELTVAFVRDLFGSAAPSSSSGLDAAGLACAASPEVCRDKLFGASSQGIPAGAGSAMGGASTAFSLGFMQSVGSVQVSPQYGLSFLQAGAQSAGQGGGTAGAVTSPERWEVSYGASSQPAAVVASVEGSSGWSASGLQFQSTSTSQVQSYMARGASGLLAGGGQVSPLSGSGGGGLTPVSEPPVMLLAGAALAGLWMQRRRQARKA